jgi:hypothetical protein
MVLAFSPLIQNNAFPKSEFEFKLIISAKKKRKRK